MCALLVVDRFSLKSVTIGKFGNILSRVSGESREPGVLHDIGITRHFDENVFKTKAEAERSVSFITPSNNGTGRVKIIKTARLRGRRTRPENNKCF